jgi:hypothetical protein
VGTGIATAAACFATTPVIDQVRHNNQRYRGYQENQLVFVKCLFEKQQRYTHSK